MISKHCEGDATDRKWKQTAAAIDFFDSSSQGEKLR